MGFEFLIGIASIGFGCLTLVGRMLGWEKMFGKRQAMKDQFGDQVGDIIHFVAYTALPIVFGALFVIK